MVDVEAATPVRCRGTSAAVATPRAGRQHASGPASREQGTHSQSLGPQWSTPRRSASSDRHANATTDTPPPTRKSGRSNRQIKTSSCRFSPILSRGSALTCDATRASQRRRLTNLSKSSHWRPVRPDLPMSERPAELREEKSAQLNQQYSTRLSRLDTVCGRPLLRWCGTGSAVQAEDQGDPGCPPHG